MRPRPTVGPRSRMYQCMHLCHTLRIAKHVGGQVGTVEHAIGAIHSVAYSPYKCSAQPLITVHQLLGPRVAIIYRHAHQGEQSRHYRFAASYAAYYSYSVWITYRVHGICIRLLSADGRQHVEFQQVIYLRGLYLHIVYLV